MGAQHLGLIANQGCLGPAALCWCGFLVADSPVCASVPFPATSRPMPFSVELGHRCCTQAPAASSPAASCLRWLSERSYQHPDQPPTITPTSKILHKAWSTLPFGTSTDFETSSTRSCRSGLVPRGRSTSGLFAPTRQADFRVDGLREEVHAFRGFRRKVGACRACAEALLVFADSNHHLLILLLLIIIIMVRS